MKENHLNSNSCGLFMVDTIVETKICKDIKVTNEILCVILTWP